MSDDVQSEVGTAFGHETTQMLAVCMRSILQMTDASIEKGIVDRCKANNITFTAEVRRDAAEKVWNAVCRQNRKTQFDFMTKVVEQMSDIIKLYKESLMIFILSKYSAMPNSSMYKINYHIPDIQTFLFRFMCKAGREQLVWGGLQKISISDQMILVKTLLRMVFLDVIRDANCIVILKNPQQPTVPPLSDFPPPMQQAPQPPQQTPPLPQITEEVTDSADNLSAQSATNPFIEAKDLPVLDKSTTPAQVAAAIAQASGDLKRDVLEPPPSVTAPASPGPITTPASPAPAPAPTTAPASPGPITTPASVEPAPPATPTATDAIPTTPTTPTTTTPATETKVLSMTGGEAGSTASAGTATPTDTAAAASAASSGFSFPTEVPAVTLLQLDATVDNAQQFVPPLPLAAPEVVAKYTVDGAGGITAKDQQDNGLHLPMSDTSFGSEVKKIVTIMPEQVKNVITMTTVTPAVKPDDSITSRLPGPATVSTPVVPSS